MATADSSAMTLDKYAMQSEDPGVKKITFSLYQTVNVAKDIPLKTMPDLHVNGVRYTDNLPSVTWGRLNETPTVVSGKPRSYQAEVALIRNQFQFDTRFLKQKNHIVDPVKIEFDAWMQNLQYELNDTFINNDPANSTSGDANAWVGIRTRLDNYSTYGHDSNCLVNGGGADITTSMTATTAQNFLEKFKEAIYSIDPTGEGEGVVAYMNDTVIRRFERAVSIAGAGAGWDTSRDAFGRKIETFRGVKLRNIGHNSTTRSASTLIIKNTETAAGADGASTFTSIYFVKYGEGSFSGWQTNPLAPKRLGLSTENGVFENVVIDWGIGLWVPSVFSVARLYNIKMS